MWQTHPWEQLIDGAPTVGSGGEWPPWVTLGVRLTETDRFGSSGNYLIWLLRNSALMELKFFGFEYFGSVSVLIEISRE